MEFKASSSLEQSHRRHGNVLVDYTKRGKDVANRRCVEQKWSRETSRLPLETRRDLQYGKSFNTIVSSDYLSDEGIFGDDLVDFYFKIPSRETRREKRDDSMSNLTRRNHGKGRKLKKKSIIQSVLDFN
jgi:hypothetical protein